MFGISSLELVVIAVVALIVIGPERLPEVAAKLGRLTGTIRRQADQLRREFTHTIYPPEAPPPIARPLTTTRSQAPSFDEPLPPSPPPSEKGS